MKKPNFKNILKRLTIVDIAIILLIIVAVVFAFSQVGADDDKGQSVSFDSSTLNKLVEKYLSFYRDGNVIKTSVGGYNSSSGEYQELHGTVLWVDDNSGAGVRVLIDVDGESVLAGLYKDVKNADIYIEHITLETTGEKYKNVTEFKINPMQIDNLNEINEGIPNNTNYTVSTTIATDLEDSQSYQELSNELYINGKRNSIRPLAIDAQSQLLINMAKTKEIAIASEILGSLNGQTDIITIRIYGTTEKDIAAIKNAYDVINIRKIT
ncbi:hypothetical protein MBCUT_14810 [Methanobrevibacter cuticularis]|uniref:Uncharacterized protein n=1 Tax=Methanobrevibacter cuticularis TaxID=47311 RepID=A0A166DDS4_9EURY|nr:hypothetical protein [Methanobrevibacter cuticularis]KZX15484.1 hypothetical protein MBCUT_14810 [Methanobrevibacter cuticularis]